MRAALAAPEGVQVPERTAVFTVRLAPSLIGRLRSLARARSQSLSATVAQTLSEGLEREHAERRGDGGVAG